MSAVFAMFAITLRNYPGQVPAVMGSDVFFRGSSGKAAEPRAYHRPSQYNRPSTAANVGKDGGDGSTDIEWLPPADWVRDSSTNTCMSSDCRCVRLCPCAVLRVGKCTHFSVHCPRLSTAHNLGDFGGGITVESAAAYFAPPVLQSENHYYRRPQTRKRGGAVGHVMIE